MIHKVSVDPSLLEQAYELERTFPHLLGSIQHYTRQHPENTEIIKTMLKSILKTKPLHNCRTIIPFCHKIDAITTVDEAFKFLVDHNFVGHLNFQLLEQLSSEVICGEEGNKKVQDKLSEYKKCYGKFLKEKSFSKIIQVFEEYPRLNPDTIIGLPKIVVILTMKWQERTKKDLQEWVPFIEENRALLESMKYKCIRITYAVFPIDLLNIMDFLNDPNNIKTLKDNGISIETPSDTLEITQLIREEEEKERISSLALNNRLLLQELLEKVNSLEKELTQEKDERIAEQSHWMTQIIRLKKEFNQKIQDLTNELERVVKMLEREQKNQEVTPEETQKSRANSSDRDSAVGADISYSSS